MNPGPKTLLGFVVVTVAETAGLWLWLFLWTQDQAVYGFLCLLLGEGIEWIFLATFIARSDTSHPYRTGRVPQAIALVGAMAIAEAALWVVWVVLVDRIGIVTATLVLLLLMHLKHMAELSIITGRRYLLGLFEGRGVFATIAETGGAAVWLVLFRNGDTVLALAVLVVCLGVEHYLQFLVGEIGGRERSPVSHTFLTCAIPFSEDRADAVNGRLDELGNPAKKEVRDALRHQRIHFLSLTVVPGEGEHSTFLLVECSFDGTEAGAIAALADPFGDHLRVVLNAAGLNIPDSETLRKLLWKHSRTVSHALFATPGLNFTGTPGMTADRIQREYELAREVRGIVENGIEGTPLTILKAVRKRIEDNGVFQDLLSPEDVPLLREPLVTQVSVLSLVIKGVFTFFWPPMLVGALCAIALVAWVTPLVGLGFALLIGFVLALAEAMGLAVLALWLYSKLRTLERTDPADDLPPDPEIMAEVMRREDATEQNHLALVSVMKAGFLRRMILRVVFWVIGQASATYRPGFLGMLGTIHFARWILLPGTNKLLFFSNYGGSWESYLEDFITKAHAGLTAVWSNTAGFPQTRNIFQDGATDGDRFKRWARRQQHPTRFWYAAYPHLTTERIRINSAIRHGLATATVEDQAAIWLSCIGSRPRSSEIIETIDIQKIMFGGLGPLTHAHCILFRLPEGVKEARAWLSEVEKELSFGEGPLGDCARVLGLTASGINRLLSDGALLQQFPIAFQQGMSVPHRAQLLRDTGEDKPGEWWWGHGDRSVDAVLLLYHRSQEACDKDIAHQRDCLQRHQGRIIHEIIMQIVDPSKPTREPFGFVDGVSQPMIRGTRLWTTDSDPIHDVAPGEFILGYPDNHGRLPHSPTVPAEKDPHCHLPALQRAIVDSPVPIFDSSVADGPRDFGRNGSFLVIRQLEQDVKRFNEFISQAAEDLIQRPRPGALPTTDKRQMEEWVAAKMVGRWRDGTSLIRYQDHPGNGWPWEQNASGPAVDPDNLFLPGAEDPLGYRCPFGAHIRRTNPRDSLMPGSTDQVAISNRHRILRVGRPYGPQRQNGSEPSKPGLLFMCLNANIERQFEFIQQTWAMARLFHGLDGEVDSIIGRGGRGGRLSIPTPLGPILIHGIDDFVTVRGGSYFFVPSHRALRYLSSPSDPRPAP